MQFPLAEVKRSPVPSVISARVGIAPPKAGAGIQLALDPRRSLPSAKAGGGDDSLSCAVARASAVEQLTWRSSSRAARRASSWSQRHSQGLGNGVDRFRFGCRCAQHDVDAPLPDAPPEVLQEGRPAL